MTSRNPDNERFYDLLYYYRTQGDLDLARNAQRLAPEASPSFRPVVLDIADKAHGGVKLSWRQRETLAKHCANATIKQEEEAT